MDGLGRIDERDEEKDEKMDERLMVKR